MRIGQAAAASGCHFETIRYYERIGLLSKPRRSPNSYRDYSADEVARLRFIVRGRELGFNLEEIRRLLTLSANGERSCLEVDRLANQQLQAVKSRILDLQRLAETLERTISSCNQRSCSQCSILDALQHAGVPATLADGAEHTESNTIEFSKVANSKRRLSGQPAEA